MSEAISWRAEKRDAPSFFLFHFQFDLQIFFSFSLWPADFFILTLTSSLFSFSRWPSDFFHFHFDLQFFFIFTLTFRFSSFSLWPLVCFHFHFDLQIFKFHFDLQIFNWSLLYNLNVLFWPPVFYLIFKIGFSGISVKYSIALIWSWLVGGIFFQCSKTI